MVDARSIDSSLERFGAQVTQRRVTPLAIVEDLDPFEHRQAGLGRAGPALLMQQLPLERSKKTLHHRIVITVAAAAHAAGDLLLGQQTLVILAGILHAATAVVQQ